MNQFPFICPTIILKVPFGILLDGPPNELCLWLARPNFPWLNAVTGLKQLVLPPPPPPRPPRPFRLLRLLFLLLLYPPPPPPPNELLLNIMIFLWVKGSRVSASYQYISDLRVSASWKILRWKGCLRFVESEKICRGLCPLCGSLKTLWISLAKS